MRVVEASENAELVWMDGTARTGDDSPGLLGLGLVPRFADLETRELKRLGASLAATFGGKAPAAPACPTDRRFRPRVAFRSPKLDASRIVSVAVLPFVNDTPWRRAGDTIALELVRQLAAVPRLRVLEPGVVRQRLIANRVIMEGGVSVEVARLLLDKLDADLVVAGYVRDFSDGVVPRVNFTVLALERERGLIMWESTSHATGTDGAWFFELGRISTAHALACRLESDVVKAFLEPDHR